MRQAIVSPSIVPQVWRALLLFVLVASGVWPSIARSAYDVPPVTIYGCVGGLVGSGPEWRTPGEAVNIWGTRLTTNTGYRWFNWFSSSEGYGSAPSIIRFTVIGTCWADNGTPAGQPGHAGFSGQLLKGLSCTYTMDSIGYRQVSVGMPQWYVAGNEERLFCRVASDPSPDRNPKTLGEPDARASRHVGCPIDCSNGNKFLRQTDYRGQGQFAMWFERRYNSTESPMASDIGPQWRHTFSRSIAEAPPSGKAFAYREDGKMLVFTLVGGTFLPDSDISDALERGGRYRRCVLWLAVHGGLK